MDSLDFMIPITLTEIPGVLTMLMLATYTGRLLPMKVSFIVICLCFLAFAAAQGTELLCISIGISTFFLEGTYGVYHAYVPEAYPTEIRATACGWINSMGLMAGASLPFATAYIKEHFGVQVYAPCLRAMALSAQWVRSCSYMTRLP